MVLVTLKQSISQADYNMLQRQPERIQDFCYWAAKFCTGYPAEGYGIYNPRIEQVDKYTYHVIWECRDSCD